MLEKLEDEKCLKERLDSIKKDLEECNNEKYFLNNQTNEFRFLSFLTELTSLQLFRIKIQLNKL